MSEVLDNNMTETQRPAARIKELLEELVRVANGKPGMVEVDFIVIEGVQYFVAPAVAHLILSINNQRDALLAALQRTESAPSAVEKERMN